MKTVYIIGSMSNEVVPETAKQIRAAGFEAFDSWYSPGPEADEYWKAHAIQQGQSYSEALKDYHARNVFEFDKRHLDRCDMALLVMPAGRSGHLELGYMIGSGKRAWILLDSPDRWDIMVQFATGWSESLDEIIHEMKETNNE